MILYIYDDYLKKYGKKITNLEIELHKLNLNGKIIYLETAKNLDSIIKDEINSGTKTIIAVGNNLTLNKTLNSIVNGEKASSSNIALGIIPIGDNNSIANALGIKNEKDATEIILARRLESVNLAKANEYYFISEAVIDASNTILEIDNFSISPISKGLIRVINLLSEKCSTQNISINPSDGLLNLLIDNKGRKPSLLSTKALKINNNNGRKLTIDNCIELESPIKIEIITNNINFIVGKNRKF